MTRSLMGLAVSWVALIVGLVAVGMSTLPGGGQYMGWFMIDHGLVILNVIAASMILRRRRSGAVPFRWPGARRLFAPWLIATGGLAALALLALHVLLPVDLLLPSGQHLVLVSHALDAAASAPGHKPSNEETLGLFAHGWVVAAFAGMCTWHLIALRDEQSRKPASEPAQRRHLDDGVDPEGRLAFRRRLLIVAIWALAVVWSAGVLSLGPFIDRRMCDAAFPWQFALLPPVLFSVSALFAKRAQHMSPWLSEMVDSRFGAGAYARFLVSLKPMLLIAACALIGAAAAMRACEAFPFMSLFFASGALGFALAHFIMRARKIEGV